MKLNWSDNIKPGSGNPDELVNRAIGGDREAERRLFERLAVRFRYVAKRYAVGADAEDLVQDACTTIFEKFRTETFTRGFYPWSYGVLRMKIGNYLQHKKRRGDRQIALHEGIPDGSSSGDSSLRRLLLECLGQMVRSKPRYARILNLSHQGYTTDQICSRLKMNANQYYVALNRSRSRLRACLKTKGAAL